MKSWKEIERNDVKGKIGRYGKVTVEIFRRVSFRLHWQQEKKSHYFTIGGGFTLEAYKAAIAKAQLINGYLANEKYCEIDKLISKKQKPVISTAKQEINLYSIWKSYKAIKSNTIALSTKEVIWSLVDRSLEFLTKEALLLDNSDLLLTELRNEYSDTTIEKFLTSITSATNLAIELGKFQGKNPYPKLRKLLNLNKRSSKAVYSVSEVEIIIDAFRSGQYDNPNLESSISYYANFVEFRFLTGVRISEAIALTWNDIKFNVDSDYLIEINKAKPGKELQLYTKTRKNRTFKSNRRLADLIDSIPQIDNENKLVFPTKEKKTYIDRANFNKNYWKPVIEKLVKEGRLKQYLPFKDTRHTYITHLVDSGMHDKAVAAICGNSPKVINDNYYRKSKDDWSDYNIPEIY